TRARDRLVPVHDRELVPRADARHEVLHRDVVLRLRDVVEARVVHDARAGAHALDPRAAANAVGRVERAADLVMLEPDGMTDLVRDTEFDETAHERIRERNAAGARIIRR